MGMNIEGTVALVTGANRGIGLAIVEDLLEAGAAKVYAGVRSIEKAEPLRAKYGDRVEGIEIDVASPDSITQAAKVATDVQIIVNNAGVLRTSTALGADAVEHLQFEIDVNVYGLLRMSQAFAPVLKSNGGGALVQLNSVASVMAFPDFATYCASKAASYSLTQSLRHSLAEQGTHVVSVHPGPIATDMANDAGLGENADPPNVVSSGILNALRESEFHVFPDAMAQQVGAMYESFATNVLEAAPAE